MSIRIPAAESLAQLRHALRTPLNHIIGYAEMLAEDESSNQTCGGNAEVLGALVTEAQRVCDYIQNLSAPDEDSERAISELRNRIQPHITHMTHYIRCLHGGSHADVDRIASAIEELDRFVATGSAAPGKPDLRPRASVKIDRGGNRYGHILIVDDDEGNRDILRRHLERQGYTVHDCADGPQALRLLRQVEFEAVLLDLVMPGLDGLDVLDELKRDPQLRDLPVLVISASDDLAGIADSIQRGAEDYLVKPFDPMLLQVRLSATLDRKRLRDRDRLRNAELERLTFELQRSNEDLQRFAYAASHDLQAPVRTITSYIQLLQRRLKGKLTDDQREMFAFAEGAAKRMHVLIRDLLQYSQVTTGETRLERVNTNELLDALILDMESVIQEASATVTHDLLPTVVYDSTRLRQLFQNLIGNAIKYRSDHPPAVSISAYTGPDDWRFSVRDNGQGIPAEHAARIFEMFQRLHGDDIPGSGIGLALCKRIVQSSGGNIWVESTSGQGSTFFFTIPFPSPLRDDVSTQ